MRQKDWTAPTIPHAEKFREVRRINYAEAGNEYQSLFLSVPRNAERTPTVVFFHGGGMTRDVRETPDELFENARYIVAECRYRLSPEFDPRYALEDAADAVAWVLRNIADCGGDPARVFLGGMSAGAWLAALVGMDPKLLARRGFDCHTLLGLVLISGQMTTHFQLKADLKYPGPRYRPVIDEYAPLYYAAADVPPVLLVTGEPGRDIACRAEENALMRSALKALGHKDVSHFIMTGCDHVGAFYHSGTAVSAFLLRHTEKLFL